EGNVTLYTGVDCKSGAGNCWSINPLVLLESGWSANAYGLEIDIQNNSGTTFTGLSTPFVAALNLSVNSNASNGINAAAILSAGGGATFAYGIVATNSSVGTAFLYDNANATTSYLLNGTHTYGIDMQGATLTTGLRFPNGVGTVGRNPGDTADVPIASVNTNGNVMIGNIGSGTEQFRIGQTNTTSYSVGRNGSTGFLNFAGNQTGFIGYTFGGVDGTALTLADNLTATFGGQMVNSHLTTDSTHTTATVCEDTTSHQFYFGSGTAGVCAGTSSARFKTAIGALTYGLLDFLWID